MNRCWCCCRPGRGGSAELPFTMLVPMAAIFLIFYFLLIRPSRSGRRSRRTMLKAIEKGDQVVTTGGLHGKVTGHDRRRR